MARAEHHAQSDKFGKAMTATIFDRLTSRGASNLLPAEIARQAMTRVRGDDPSKA
jgi:hypothetical protein